jgi:CheY-like chemotaxis protein
MRLSDESRLYFQAERSGTAKVAGAGDGKLILVVDDEMGVREVTRRMLESFGYRALAVENGAEGLVAYAEHREEIVLVITDLMMPIMDGPAMVVELRRQSADLPICR